MEHVQYHKASELLNNALGKSCQNTNCGKSINYDKDRQADNFLADCPLDHVKQNTVGAVLLRRFIWLFLALVFNGLNRPISSSCMPNNFIKHVKSETLRLTDTRKEFLRVSRLDIRSL
jgi:hypothetical protein